jgi:hypothetical protein
MIGTEDWHRRLAQKIGTYDAVQLVFVDECGSHLAMTPLYARAPQGHRAVGNAPRTKGTNTTLLAALNLERAGTECCLDD